MGEGERFALSGLFMLCDVYPGRWPGLWLVRSVGAEERESGILTCISHTSVKGIHTVDLTVKVPARKWGEQ